MSNNFCCFGSFGHPALIILHLNRTQQCAIMFSGLDFPSLFGAEQSQIGSATFFSYFNVLCIHSIFGCNFHLDDIFIKFASFVILEINLNMDPWR
jgi:hypothetical protein